jgi:regulator of CtrA degradation
LAEPGRIAHVKGFGQLPEGLQRLIVASFALNDRIVRLDMAMQVDIGQADRPSPVLAQVARIERAFAGRGQPRRHPSLR